jgi:uncharacterized ion transporter superfamily protein YfcC
LNSDGASLATSTKVKVANAANPIMEAGITFQVITLLIFGTLALELYIRYKRDVSTSSSTTRSIQNRIPTSQPTLQQYDPKFKKAVLAVVVAYFAILIRCIYRIAEMAGGLRNPIMQNQAACIVFDGVMCVIACVVLNVFHPGEIFRKSKGDKVNGSRSSTDAAVDTEMVTLVQTGTEKRKERKCNGDKSV